MAINKPLIIKNGNLARLPEGEQIKGVFKVLVNSDPILVSGFNQIAITNSDVNMLISSGLEYIRLEPVVNIAARTPIISIGYSGATYQGQAEMIADQSNQETNQIYRYGVHGTYSYKRLDTKTGSSTDYTSVSAPTITINGNTDNYILNGSTNENETGIYHLIEDTLGNYNLVSVGNAEYTRDTISGGGGSSGQGIITALSIVNGGEYGNVTTGTYNFFEESSSGSGSGLMGTCTVSDNGNGLIDTVTSIDSIIHGGTGHQVGDLITVNIPSIPLFDSKPIFRVDSIS